MINKCFGQCTILIEVHKSVCNWLLELLIVFVCYSSSAVEILSGSLESGKWCHWKAVNEMLVLILLMYSVHLKVCISVAAWYLDYSCAFKCLSRHPILHLQSVWLVVLQQYKRLFFRIAIEMLQNLNFAKPTVLGSTQYHYIQFRCRQGTGRTPWFIHVT
jgi:hypothetical protein